MESKNIINNVTLEQYKKKYKNRDHRLLKYTKKQVEDFDKQYGHYIFNNKTYNLEFECYLLKNKKWALIGDTYYEIPKPVRFTWFRNLNAGVQISLCALAAAGVGSAVAFPTIFATKSTTQNVIVNSNEVECQHSFQPDGSVKGNIKAKTEDKDVLSLEIKIGDYTLTKYEFKFDQETGDFEIYAEIIKEHKGDIVITPTFAEKKEKTFLFPQTVVSDPSIELMAAGQDKQDEEYFKFKNEYYVKDTAVPYEQSGFNATFSNGIQVNKGERYYFKCEVVDWQTKEKTTGESSIIMSEKVLYACQYDAAGNTSLDNASIKNWLNNYFYNNVFKNITNIVVPYTSTESTASVTNMNVWIPSASEISKWDSEKEKRIKEVTDFAICNGAKYEIVDEKNLGHYWTRTDSGVVMNGGDCLDYVNHEGNIVGTSTGPTEKNMGVVPCIKVNYEQLK